MPSIHKNLVLDHIYFSLLDDEFLELKSIFSKFECVSHDIVNSDGESWEGLYLFTRGLNYLEFVHEYRADAMGICQKPFGTLSQNAAHITSDFPNLSWKTFTRTIDQKPWFTTYSCEDSLDKSILFTTWVMKYHQRDSEHLSVLRKYEIERVSQVELSASPEMLETIQKNSSWMNAQIEFDSKKVTYKFQTYFSDDYEVVINFNEKVRGFRFESVTIHMNEPGLVESNELRIFKSEIISSRMKISRIKV